MKQIKHVVPTSADIVALLDTHKVSQKLASELIGCIGERQFKRCIAGEYNLTASQWFYLQHMIKDY